MFNFPEILSERLSCFIPGSKSILTVSTLDGARVNFSDAQLNGGSILMFIVVGKGPPFLMSRVLAMGIEGTPFSQRYLK